MCRKYSIILLGAMLFAGVGTIPYASATDIQGGHITKDTVWTSSGNPYNILGTIIIDPGVKLTIGPGVIVHPSPGITIYVEGMMNISGTPLEKVTFSGTDWNGIVINSTSPWTKVTYASIEGANVPLTSGKTNLTVSYMEARGCRTCLVMNRTVFTGDNLTLTSNGYGVVSDYSRINLRDSVIRAGKGADSSTGNGSDGSTGVVMRMSGIGIPGNSTIFNVTIYGGNGGNATSPGAHAGNGGPGIHLIGGEGIFIEQSKIYGGDGGVASLQAEGSGRGGQGILIEGSNYTWIRSVVHGGNGGRALAVQGVAGSGGNGIEVSGPVASSYMTLTGSKVYGGSGGEANATSSTGGNGGDAIYIDSTGAVEFELFSMEISGGKGGDASGAGTSPGSGGNALTSKGIRRMFAYGNIATGGQGGNVYGQSTARGGNGGIAINIVYAENGYSELGIFTGGKGGDDHSLSGKGGGPGGEGVVIRGGKVKVEVGETNVYGGGGGDVYHNPNAPAGNGAEYAARFIGGSGIIFEYASAEAGKGGRHHAGGSNGRAGNVSLFTVTPSKVILNGFYGVQGETDHCIMVYNTSVTMSGGITGYCRYGVIVDSPSGGVTPSLTSQFDTFWKGDAGIMARHGAKLSVSDAIIKDLQQTGVILREGSSGTWSDLQITTTPIGLLVNGSSSVIAGSSLNATMYDIVAENASTLTLTNTTFSDAKVKVKDPGSKVMVRNYLDVAVVDRRGNPVPRPELWVYDGTTLVLRETLKKPGTRTGILLTDRMITPAGTVENKTSIKVIYRNWTFKAVPGPINDINMSTSHLEYIIGNGATPPRVNFTTPGSDETDVSPGSRIKIGFSVPMNTTSVEDSITITGNVTPCEFTWSPDRRVVEFGVSPWLLPETSYEINLNSSIAKDDIGLYLDGNPDGASFGHPLDDYTWSFTTGATPNMTVLGNDTAPPTVNQGQTLIPMLVFDLVAEGAPSLFQSVTVNKTGTSPESDVESVSLWLDMNSNARWDAMDKPMGFTNFTAGCARFDMPGNGLVVTPKKVEHMFILINITGNALVARTVGVQIPSDSAIHVLGARVNMPFPPIASANATVGGDITPPNVTSASPRGSGIDIKASISVTFNELMNWTSVKDAFTITPSVDLEFAVSGYSAVLTPKGQYTRGTTYTVRILGSVARDISGNLLDGNGNGVSEGSPVDDYTWSFTTQPMPEGTLEGNVVDDAGSPVGNVSITVDQMKTATDPSGNYSIRSIPAGSYNVTFTKAGFETLTVKDIVINQGKTTWLNVSITMLAGRISGAVIDSETQKGIEGVKIEIAEIPGMVSITDSSGIYSFIRVPIGNYTLIASKEGYKQVLKNVTVRHQDLSVVDFTLEKIQEEGGVSPFVYVAIGVGIIFLLVILYLLVMGRRWKGPVPEGKKEEKPEKEKEKGKSQSGEEKRDEEKGDEKDSEI